MDIVKFLGIDAIASVVIYFVKPTLLKYVLMGGLIALLGFFILTRQGRISIYASQVVMAVIVAFQLG